MDKHRSNELQPWLIVPIVSALQALEFLLCLDKDTNHLKVKEISFIKQHFYEQRLEIEADPVADSLRGFFLQYMTALTADEQ